MKKFKRKIELEDFEAIQFYGENTRELSLFLKDVMIEKHGILDKIYNGNLLYTNLSDKFKKDALLQYLIIVDNEKGNLKVEVGDWVFKNKDGKILVFNDKYVNKNFEQYDN